MVLTERPVLVACFIDEFLLPLLLCGPLLEVALRIALHRLPASLSDRLNLILAVPADNSRAKISIKFKIYRKVACFARLTRFEIKWSNDEEAKWSSKK